ncbi:MAG TPA: hypothetical protein PKC18_18935, partial [Lacipirellulaceae bacterium]|nr:hypothetical protein [Lacipirellulaceae bacterium]
ILDGDPFRNWEEARLPFISVNGAVRNALDILYSGLDPKLGQRFLDRAWALIERTDQDKKIDAERGQVGFFMHRAQFLLDKTLTLALREGAADLR